MRDLFLLGMTALVCACGGVIGGAPDGGDAGSDVVVTPPSSQPGQPPPPPTGGTPAGNETRTFAMRSIFLGETSRNNSAPSVVAWKDFGYNVDGLVTTKDSTDVCTLTVGAPKAEQIDGNQGIDNTWGSSILPILETAASLPTPSQSVSQFIQSGGTTLEIQVDGLAGDPSQSSTGLTAQAFVGGRYQGTPTFDTTTDWPVLQSSKTTYPNAYITNGTFVSGEPSGVLTLNILGVFLPVFIHHAIITIDSSGNGTIAGVLDPNEFIATFKANAGRITASLCGSAFDGVAAQILQAQDILLDGSNTSGKPCSGLSIGIGFTAVQIANPTQTQADPTLPPNPCP